MNHLDGDKSNNKVENLEWATHAEQTKHSRAILEKGLNDRPVVAYDENTLEEVYRFKSLADTGRFFAQGKSHRGYQSSVWRALSGRRKTYKGYIWKYLD